MAMGICRQGSLSGGELGREIPSAVRGTVQLPFFVLHNGNIFLLVVCMLLLFHLTTLDS
ncbi:hypothetical protein Hanom_Chr09g00796161 [Helianthus anomalus]